jgi:hypothetical protein
MVTRPTDFPGLVIDPYRQCVVNQVEVGRFPVRVCECFSDCTNPGAPFPFEIECFIYGEQLGDMDRGCPIITGGALGVTLGMLETHFLVRLQLTADTDFLSGGGNVSDTALRFNLYLAKPIGVYEVFLVDDQGQRAWVSFTPSIGSVLWVNIPLDDFTLLDLGFNWDKVRYVYFGFTHNYQVATCMMAIDNLRVCTNQTPGGVGGLAFEVDSEPYGGNNPGDSCFFLEEFESEMVLERVVCDADEPESPTPEPCDECYVGPPLIDGNGAVHFRVCDIPSPFYPPSIRYIPTGPIILTTDVTFTVYSWRPGVNVRVVMVDEFGRRAIHNFVAVGGSQTVTVLLAAFTFPDAGFDWLNVTEWWTIFGTAGVNSNDRFALDELRTNGGATLINDMSTLTDIQCGYDPEPVAPGTTLTCEFVNLQSILYPPNPNPIIVKFNALTWEGDLSVGTVSQVCTDPLGYWDLGFNDVTDVNADVQIAFNLLVAPPATVIREIILTLFDEVGREVMIAVAPPALSIGDNILTINMNDAKVVQPTLESKGQFNARRCVYWQVGFVGMTSIVFPFVINFEGFHFRYDAGLGKVVTKTFLFNSYADPLAFEGAGGYTCFEDWRLVQITHPDTGFYFLVGGGVTVGTDPAFDMRNIGVDRGKMPIGVDGQEVRAERWFDPAEPTGGNWSEFRLRYRARPDPGPPAKMHLVIQVDNGKTAVYSFDNGAGVLQPDGSRMFSTLKSNMAQNLGAVGSDAIRLVRLVKEGITNWPRTGSPGTGADIFSGDEVDLVRGTLFVGGFSAMDFYGKAIHPGETVQSVGAGSIGAMGGDDQPPMFDGHVHHETEPGDTPPAWPFGPSPTPYHAAFNGWLKINKLMEGPTSVMRVALPAPIDITAHVANQNAFFHIFAIGTAFFSGTLWTIRNIKLRLYDGDGIGGYSDIFLGVNQGFGGSGVRSAADGWASFNLIDDFPADDVLKALLFRLCEKQDGPSFNMANVVAYDLIAEDGWYVGKTWFFQNDIGNWNSPALLWNWNRSTWPQLIGFTNPSNQFSVGKALDPNTTPVVALNCDKTKGIAYWGMHEDWLRSAEIVLVPAKYRDDPIVGIDGNRGYDEFGNPLPGVLEALARDTGAWYGNIAFKSPPFKGCRNIWMDFCYLDEVVCLGTDLEKALYNFWDTECPCYGPPQEISNLVTHYRGEDPPGQPLPGWLDRILPDDQFILEMGAQPLPSGYPEAIQFEYCAIPDLDTVAEDDTDPAFTFRRETPSCSRPDDPINSVFGHYVVRVTLTAKQAPITINWADVLPPGETLIQGAMSDAAIVLVNVGDVAVREYMLRTAQLDGGSAAITGAAVVVPNPPVTLVSPATLMDLDCDTLSWRQFGSQNPNVYGVVYWAGWGRPDPVAPPGTNLWTKVWAGPGSAGLSKREQYLFSDATIPASTASWVFQLGGTGIEGFALGLPVWAFNTDFVDNPVRRITGLDIEAEEASANPDEEVTGLYGVVTAIDPNLMTVTVQFNVPPDQQVRFTMLAKACLMVAPDQSRGYYWEASPALVDVCKLAPYTDPLVKHTVLRWGFRYWNSTKYPAPGTNGAGYICDGDGESLLYEIHGEIAREVINPVDWMDLLCSPVQETKLLNNALPAQDDVRVCDYCLFEPCDIIQIVDENCTGKEGSGPGYVGAVVATAPDDPSTTCDTFYAAEGHVQIIPAIPSAVVGCGSIDGFKTTRRARVFVKPDVARYAYIPTTKVYPDGVPVDGQNFVGVDFETGTFTFLPGAVVSNPCACFRAINSIIQLNVQEPGIYFLKGIDKSGCKSPPSKPIKIVGPSGEEPDTCGVGECPTLLFHNSKQHGEKEYAVQPPTTYEIVSGTDGPAVFAFLLTVPSRVEFRVSLFGWDVARFLDSAVWTELWVKDEITGIYYPLADRFAYGNVADIPAVEGDSGAGSVISRVVDLPARNHVFGLYVKNGNAQSYSRIRGPIDLQVWRFGRCTPPPPPPL